MSILSIFLLLIQFIQSLVARQQKFLREKMGGAEDEMEEEEEEEEKDHAVWSRSKRQYYDADEVII